MASTVLLTGASGGLGIHVAKRFAKAQWNIIATFYSGSSDQLTQIPTCTAISCDLTDQNAVEQLTHSLPEQLDAVVHLVGGIKAGQPLEVTHPEDFEFMWRLNTLSTYLVLRSTLPFLKKSAGAFITIGSRTVLHPEPGKSLYTAAKAALVHLVLTAAEEGRSFGVRANVIVPSIIRTEANLTWARNGEEQFWVDPTDIAELIYFLCSPAGKAVTGCVIPMYGKLPA